MRSSAGWSSTARPLLLTLTLSTMSLSGCSTTQLDLLEVRETVPRVPAEYLAEIPEVPTLRPRGVAGQGRSTVTREEVVRVHAQQMEVLGEALRRLRAIREWDQKTFGARGAGK